MIATYPTPRSVGDVSGSWILLFATLCAMPILKIGEVQLLELVQLLTLPFLFLLFAGKGFRIPIHGVWREHGPWYAAFIGACLALGLLSLRLTFFPPPEISFLKQPFVISLSRIAELFLGAHFMLTIADIFRRDGRRLRQTLDIYWIVGTLSAVLSIGSAMLMAIAGVNLYFVYGQDLRVRGFFNEAGPYGVFLVSVTLVLLLRAHYFPKGFRVIRNVSLVIVLAALFQSSSKAGFLAMASLCGVIGLSAVKARQRIALIAGCVLVGGLTWWLLGFQILNYLNDYTDFEEALANRPDDPGLIMGRIVGAIIVPRMISEHPLAGVGIGNYSLVRNDPAYLQGLPTVTEWDLPGLGLVGLAAELGIPLTLLLVLLLLRPLHRARRIGAPWILLCTSAFQPVAVLVGVNINFFYPWLVTAIALAIPGDQLQLAPVYKKTEPWRPRFRSSIETVG